MDRTWALFTTTDVMLHGVPEELRRPFLTKLSLTTTNITSVSVAAESSASMRILNGIFVTRKVTGYSRGIEAI